MNFLEKIIRFFEILIPAIMKTLMVVGTICILGAAGNSDFSSEFHLPDFPQTKTLLIVGFICLGIVLIYVIATNGFDDGGSYDG